MKKWLTLILVLVMSVVFTVPAFASSFLNGWNGGEKLNFSPVINQNVYVPSEWSQDLVNKYGITWYENPVRFTLKGEVMLLQLRTIQAALRRQGYSELSANGQTLTNFLDSDSLVYTAQEEAKILKSIGILPLDNNIYMNLDYYSTRADVAKMVTAANQSVLGITAIRMDNEFTDTINHPAKAFIAYAYQIGVMDGINSSMFYPDNAVSVEQILDIMDNEVGHYGITVEDVATAMNETFRVTCNLNSTKIYPEYTSYSVKTHDYVKIKVNLYPYTDDDLVFTSYDKNICKITSTSQYYNMVTVKGIRTGSTYIKVNLKNEPGCYVFIPVYVTDNKILATGITVISDVTLGVGDGGYLATSVLPYNATDKTVQYYSNDSSIVRVNSDGRVTGVSKGIAVITAQTNNGYRAYCIVTVNDPNIYTNPTNNSRNFMYVSGYGESSYYNAFNDETMTFIVNTNLSINSVKLDNSNCYISQGVSSNVSGWQFTVKSLTFSQNTETLLTVTLSNGEQLNVRICIYP